MPAIKVCLFRKFSVLQNEREIDCFPSARARELFCYLLLHRGQPHSRETLAAVLWGECSTAQSKKYLRQTLWQLHQALQTLLAGAHAAVLQTDPDSVRVNSHEELWLDVEEFERAFAPTQGIAGERLEQRRAEDLRKSVVLYEGDLLEGCYQDWCLYHRERLENNYLAMLDKLMAYSESHGDYEGGIAYGERLLKQDRGRERTYYRLMRLQYLAGDRAGALRQYQRCAAALKQELGVEPAKRTVELCEEIRADRVQRISGEGEGMTVKWELDATKTADRALPPLRRLQRLRTVLLKIRHRAEQDIQEVDNILGPQANPSARR